MRSNGSRDGPMRTQRAQALDRTNRKPRFCSPDGAAQRRNPGPTQARPGFRFAASGYFPTAFFTSSAIRFSSADVNFINAKAVGHMFPSSSFAAVLKPKVA